MCEVENEALGFANTDVFNRGSGGGTNILETRRSLSGTETLMSTDQASGLRLKYRSCVVAYQGTSGRFWLAQQDPRARYCIALMRHRWKEFTAVNIG